MPNTSVKIKCFEFLTENLLNWFSSQSNSHNDFSKLKLFKLLFFVSAVDASESENGLLEIFDKFHAMPYGHVESDIYDNFGQLNRVVVGKKYTSIKPEIDETEYYLSIDPFKELIHQSIESLKQCNADIINYSAFDLVELSHEWQSWKSIFNLARLQNKLSLPIPQSLIKLEPKFFKLGNA